VQLVVVGTVSCPTGTCSVQLVVVGTTSGPTGTVLCAVSCSEDSQWSNRDCAVQLIVTVVGAVCGPTGTAFVTPAY
jgi:hypothetical protein